MSTAPGLGMEAMEALIPQMEAEIAAATGETEGDSAPAEEASHEPITDEQMAEAAEMSPEQLLAALESPTEAEDPSEAVAEPATEPSPAPAAEPAPVDQVSALSELAAVLRQQNEAAQAREQAEAYRRHQEELARQQDPRAFQKLLEETWAEVGVPPEEINAERIKLFEQDLEIRQMKQALLQMQQQQQYYAQEAQRMTLSQSAAEVVRSTVGDVPLPDAAVSQMAEQVAQYQMMGYDQASCVQAVMQQYAPFLELARQAKPAPQPRAAQSPKRATRSPQGREANALRAANAKGASPRRSSGHDKTTKQIEEELMMMAPFLFGSTR